MMKTGGKLLCLVLGLCAIQDQGAFGESHTKGSNFVPIYEWSQLEFDYATPNDRQRDIGSGFFIPGVPAPIDVDVYYAPDKTHTVFVTIPRFQTQPGSPIALGTITNRNQQGNPILKPYPSWSWHRNPERCNRDRIVSIYRIKIDECGRLWIMDSGRYGDSQTCQPQLLAFDLKTNELIHRFEIPPDQMESRSIFVTPIVDVRDPSCRDTFVYMADCQTYSIVVYDVKRETSWRITDKTMYPYPNFGTYDILGTSFDLMDGVLGMTLSPNVPGKDRILFFHAMSSDTENYVYTSEIRNQSRYTQNPGSSPEVFHTFRGRRRSQSAAEAMDKNGIVYFGSMSDVTINCWDSTKEYDISNIEVLGNNKKTMQFASGIKVVDNKLGEQELFVLTSRFQEVATNTLNSSEKNFRILASSIKTLTPNTKCDKRNYSGPRPASNRPNGGGYSPHHRPSGGSTYGLSESSENESLSKDLIDESEVST